MGIAESWTDVMESAYRVSLLCDRERADTLRHGISQKMMEYERVWGPLPPKFSELKAEIKSLGSK